MNFTGATLQASSQEPILPSPPRSILLVAAAPCSALIPCKDKLKHYPPMHCSRSNSKAQSGCGRPRTLTMPDVSAEAFRPLLTFLGLIDNLILRRPSALFSTLVTMHLTSIPGEYMSKRECKSCKMIERVRTHTNPTILHNKRRPEFVTEVALETKFLRKTLALHQHYNKRQEIPQTPKSQYRGRDEPSY